MKFFSTVLILCFSTIVFSQQIYFSENFDNCMLPDGWTVESSMNSVGWTMGTSTSLSSEKVIYPENGTCFIGNNDDKWDNESGDQNQAVNDYLFSPFIDFSTASNLVVSIDYISGYGAGVFIEYRTENSDWKSANTAISAGVLKWQNSTNRLFGDVNSPIKDLTEPIQFRFRFSDYNISKFLGVGIDNIVFYESLNNDLRLENVHIPDVVPIGQIPILPAIFNRGVDFLEDCTLHWQIDNETIKSVNVNSFKISSGTILTYLYPYGTGTFPGETIYVDFPDAGTYNLKVWIEYNNNIIDEDLSDNYWEKTIIVKDQLPEKYYLYEKFSHNTCGPCYEADLLAQQIYETYDNLYLVSVHSSSNDPMDYPEVDIIDISYSQRSHPGSMMDRRYYDIIEHGRMSYLRSSLPEMTIPWWSAIDIRFSDKIVDLSQQVIHLKLEATFHAEMEGDIRFNIMTIEDGIKAYQASAPEGNDYIHNHVLRNYSGGNWGEENSLPSNINAGSTHVYEVTIDIDSDWDIDNLSFIGIVQNYEENDDNREILNAKQIGINEAITTDIVQIDNVDLNIYPNPTADFIYLVSSIFIDHNISYEIISNDGKVIKTASIEQSSNNYHQIDVRDLPKGVFMIQFKSNDKHILTKEFIRL